MKLETFALERVQSMWENRVAWNLSESGVHPLKVKEVANTPAHLEAILELELGYPQTNGTIELREYIAAIYPGATSAHVQVTNGGSEANCILLMRLVSPGDEIVFMTPNYMQASGLAKALGADVRPWRLAAGARWTCDLDELRRLTTPRTRAILICNPNNPTGARLTDAELDEICGIAARVGAWVVADEIYRGAERDADDTPSVWGRYERAIVSSGLSKAYGLPGLRLGWIVAPPALIDELWAVHDYTTIAPGGISDRLARVVLEPDRRATVLARTRGIIRANYPIMRRWIEKQDGLSHVAPEAGAIVFVRSELPQPTLALTERLREEQSVLIVPGEFFDMPGYLRIGFGSDPAYLESALTRVGEFLRSAGVHAR